MSISRLQNEEEDRRYWLMVAEVYEDIAKLVERQADAYGDNTCAGIAEVIRQAAPPNRPAGGSDE